MGNNNVETITIKLKLYDEPCNSKEEGVIPVIPLELIIDDEYKKKYIVKDHNIKFCREKSYGFIIVDVDGQTISGECSIIINDTEYICVSDNGYISLPTTFPFIDSLGAAQIQVKIHNNTLCYCSDCYLVESNHGYINYEANAAIRYVAEHYNMLFSEDPRTSFVGTRIDENLFAERTLKRQLLESTLEVYERSREYIKNSHSSKIIITDEVVPVSKMQSVPPRTVKYIASHTNCLVPAKKGIKYGDRYCQPAKVLSEQKERTFDVDENLIILRFLATILQEINSMISDTQKEIDALPESEERNRLAKELKELNIIQLKYRRMQQDYFSILGMCCHNKLEYLPTPPPYNLLYPPYNEIYNKMKMWFNGTFDVELRNEMLKFLSTSKLYEYYLLCKMLNSLDNRLLPLYRQEIYNIDYLHGDPDVNPQTYTQTRVADVFKYTNGVNELTLYYQPVIKIKNLNSSPYIPLLYRNDAKAKYYMPDYVFKLRNGNSVRYIILDAKYSKPSSYNNGSKNLNEMIEKYICNISCYLPWEIGRINNWYNFKPMAQKKLGMIILCGQQETNNFDYLVNWLDYEQYAVLPAVASAEYNRSSAPNMVDNVVQYVVDSFFQPLNVNGPNKPPITLPDLSFQDYFKKR